MILNLPTHIEFACEMRDVAGAVDVLKVELDQDEVNSVVQHLALDQSETAAALAHGYATRKAYAAAGPGFSLYGAARVDR